MRAVDKGRPPLHATTRILIDVVDLPSTSDSIPYFVSNFSAPLRLMENDEVGHRVCHVAATDPDGDKLWYYIVGELLTVATHFTHTHIRLTALFPGLPGWASTRKVKPIWILLEQETVSSSRISWAICKSAPRSRQITIPAPHHLDFYRPDALPATQPTVSVHWRHTTDFSFGVTTFLRVNRRTTYGHNQSSCYRLDTIRVT